LPKSAVLWLLTLVGALTLAACGVSPADGTSNGTVQLEVPNLKLSTYQGDEHDGGTEVSLVDVVGLGKPVVLNFWAALCPPCRAEMPDIQRVHDARGDEVTILGIDVGPQLFLGSREEGRQLLIDLGITYPAGTTFEENVARDFRLVGMPTTLFINADGSLHRSWSGLLNEEKINEFIDEMLAS
jgi:thiol-disulfide isomerase/thioredoxin